MPHHPAKILLCASVLLACSGSTAEAGAQDVHDAAHARDGVRVGAQAVPLLTHVTPAVRGETRTEAYVSQPLLAAHARLLGGRIEASGMLNLEGLTLERGELTPGIWGEGYVDRRHPHTYLHEGMVAARFGVRSLDASLAFGKGFAPFGTDDPMVRPLVKFPANHHLAQVLERLVLIGAARYGPAVFEAGLFNGEEPLNPRDFPELERFGDSWALRGTVHAARGLELQASYASIESPEFPTGDGYDHRKWSASARYEAPLRAGWDVYGLAEWARTAEWDEDRFAGERTSLLMELAAERGRLGVAARAERTLRPEEEREADPFRTPWPHADVHTIGLTRLNSAALQVSATRSVAGLAVRAFIESGVLLPQDMEPLSVFQAEEFYGDAQVWHVSVGARIGAGTMHRRMGRYGVAAGE